MRKTIQLLLAVTAIGALVVTGIAFYQIVLAANTSGAPARIVSAQAGPYTLKFALYADPINAGAIVPFAIAVSPAAQGAYTYQVTASPDPGVPGSLAQGDVDAQQTTPYGVPGSITLVTRGAWTLHILVTGPSGQGEAAIPLTAVALPPIPGWLAWNLGLLPLYGLFIFWVVQSRRRAARQPTPSMQPAR